MTHTDRFSGANHRGYPPPSPAAVDSLRRGTASRLSTDLVLERALASQGYAFSDSGVDGDRIFGATAHGFGNGIVNSGRD